MSINNVTLMGRVVNTPELKTTSKGVSVTQFRIAVEKPFQKKGEEKKVDFFNIVAWRNNAEFITRYFAKGYMIAIIGALSTREYKDKNGNNHNIVEVVVDKASFTGEKHEEQQPSQHNASAPQQNAQQPAPQQSAPQQDCYSDYGDVPLCDDDLPF